MAINPCLTIKNIKFTLNFSLLDINTYKPYEVTINHVQSKLKLKYLSNLL